VETESEQFDPFFSSCYDRGKILIEDDCENGGGKGRGGEVIHRPPKDLSFLHRHVEIIDGGMLSFQTVLISCRIKTR